MTFQRGNPPELFNSTQYGFSQVVAATGSRVIAVSGQVAWNSRQELVADDDLFSQTQRSLANVQTALRSVQADMRDVVSLRIYIVDFESEDSEAVTRALRVFFPADAAPAATWIGVACLANPGLRVEIEATAVTN